MVVESNVMMGITIITAITVTTVVTGEASTILRKDRRKGGE